jgi:threonine/homoserine/homoserine lactone efflux protein
MVTRVTQLLALVGFSFVSSITPGPNNVMLWASGAAFGFRRTLPHVLGTALGLGAMALAAAAGLAAIVTALPVLAVAMRVAGSAYLLYLAWQVARSGALRSAVIARPLGIRGGATFQLLNPKAWVFALGAVTTFRPTDLPIATGSLMVAVVMMVVILPSATVWAGAGGAMSRLLSSERTHGIVSIGLAVMLAVTVVLVWI